jgi:hypothetical protein
VVEAKCQIYKVLEPTGFHLERYIYQKTEKRLDDMAELVIQTIDESKLENAVKILEERKLLLYSKKCGICEKDIKHIGGFLPQEGKVIPICDEISCIMKASFLIMKHNGNGSPVIEK